jgi:hypothetical protein
MPDRSSTLQPAVSPLVPKHSLRAHNTRRCAHPLAGSLGPIGVGLCRRRSYSHRGYESGLTFSLKNDYIAVFFVGRRVIYRTQQLRLIQIVQCGEDGVLAIEAITRAVGIAEGEIIQISA